MEKITEGGEHIPARWPVAGTTGYDALAEVNGVLIDPAAEKSIDDIYRRLTGDKRRWAEHVEASKRFVCTTLFQAELRRLNRLTGGRNETFDALSELAVAFPVYRSYLPEGSEYLARARALALARRPELHDAVDALYPRLSDPADELCVRFQQLTGAVMAKGVEDTAFYRYTRFIGLNEVGGDPGSFGSDSAGFPRGAGAPPGAWRHRA